MNRGEEKQIKLEDLLPGNTYNCKGKIRYPNFETKNETESNWTKVKTKCLTFDITPHNFSLNLSIQGNTNKNWNLIYYYKQNLTNEGFRSLKIDSSHDPVLEGLEMLTVYKICLSLAQDDCPGNVIACQECKFETTLEYYPFPPSDVQIAEKHPEQITVTWKTPSRPSGNIINYNVQLTGKCIEKDSNCQQICSRSENLTVALESNTALSIVFNDIKPYWSYKINVSAVNSKGQGESTDRQHDTKAKPKLPSDIDCH